METTRHNHSGFLALSWMSLASWHHITLRGDPWSASTGAQVLPYVSQTSSIPRNLKLPETLRKETTRRRQKTRNWDPKFRRAQQSRTNSCLRSSLGGSMIGGLPRMKCYECYECWDKIQIIYHYVWTHLLIFIDSIIAGVCFPFQHGWKLHFLALMTSKCIIVGPLTPSRPIPHRAHQPQHSFVHRASSCWLVTVTVCLFDIKDHQNTYMLHQKYISTQPHASNETLWHASTLPSQASSRNSGPERLRIRSAAVNPREFRRFSFAPAAIKAAAHSSFPESKASIKGVAPLAWYMRVLNIVTLWNRCCKTSEGVVQLGISAVRLNQSPVWALTSALISTSRCTTSALRSHRLLH